jgi:hypothetical protein
MDFIDGLFEVKIELYGLTKCLEGGVVVVV